MSSQQKLKVDTKKVEEAKKKIDDAKNGGSLENCRTALREAYINFLDQEKKCIVDIVDYNRSEGKTFYFRPETFLLQDPEKEQKVFRENLLKRVSSMPKPEQIQSLGDELHRAMCKTLADQSQPKEAKKNLCYYFKRRQYTLQHRKHKLLCRWAHHTMTTESMKRMSNEATFLFSKLEFSLEQAIQRRSRLEQEDYFDEAIQNVRPSTSVDLGGELGMQQLYVEHKDIKSQSLIREDDIEVQTRGITYKNKVSKTVNKFLSRLKWTPLEKRYDIYKRALQTNAGIKRKNIQDQQDFADAIIKNINEVNNPTDALETACSQLRESFFISKYQNQFLNPQDRIRNSWQTDHEETPILITNQYELKLKITKWAQFFKIQCNVEIDFGYSAAHQIAQFFPSYFQKQIIKSQFSIYDCFATSEDSNEGQKMTLSNLTKVDTNIFRDISTTPEKIPSDEALTNELRNEDIKIIRMKSSAYWLSYVIMTPTIPDWLRKQNAIINNNEVTDTLIKKAFDYLDVHELDTVNQINEDSASEHRTKIDLLTSKDNPNNQFKAKSVSTTDGEKDVYVNLMPLKSTFSTAFNMEQHLLKTMQGQSIVQEKPQDPSKPPKKSATNMKFVPQHLIVTFNTLRYMKSRDAKTRVLYALNYFRAIQKRIALDLREFGTRDRIDSHLANPYSFSNETKKSVIRNSNWAPNMDAVEGQKPKNKGKRNKDGKDEDGKATELTSRHNVNSSLLSKEEEDDAFEGARKMLVFDDKALENMRNLASVRMYKVNGKFDNKIFSTCPSFPPFPTTYGEPTSEYTTSQELDQQKKKKKGISETSVKLLGRIDHIEINEASEEVFVKDDFGIYIIYDCSLQDLAMIEKDLIKLGSYFIQKQEVLQDASLGNRPHPHRDRQEVVHDLITFEASFQFQKVRLVQLYMECYEHVCDPMEQQRLMQVITDIMSRKPRIDLHAGYFRDAYTSEIECMKAQFDLLKIVINTQVSVEKAENKRLQETLNLSYVLANNYEDVHFKYADPEIMIKNLMKRQRANKGGNAVSDRKMKENLFNLEKDNIVPDEHTNAEIIKKGIQEQNQSLKDLDNHLSNKELSQKSKSVSNLKESEKKSEDSSNEDGIKQDEAEQLDAEIDEYFAPQSNQFIKLLGLPEVTVETMFLQNKDKDKEIQRIMNENVNFINTYEGYPEFIHFSANSAGTHGKTKNSFKISPWSTDVGMLDFYESLDFASKFNAIMESGQKELCDALKPYNYQFMTLIELEFTKAALEEFHKVIKIQEGAVVEYEGRQYVEDEAVLGSTEKMIFYCKEMVANLTTCPKYLINPFIMAKLDLKTIQHFDFSPLQKAQNPYVIRQFGLNGGQGIVKSEQEAILGQARVVVKEDPDRMKHLREMIEKNKQAGDVDRNIKTPPLLELYCNLTELQRLRNELIMTASENAVLLNTYQQQLDLCKKSHLKACTEESIAFLPLDDDPENPKVNYSNDGPGTSVSIGLTVREFDSSLLSNMNYKHPDSFKMSILTAGLEEVRAVLAYELMQKHLLIVATRMNQLMIDSQQKGLVEMDLIVEDNINVPNPMISINEFFSKSNKDMINTSLVNKMRGKFKSNMQNTAGAQLYGVWDKKNIQRATIQKLYADYQSNTNKTLPRSPVATTRICRTYKIKLLYKQMQTILTSCYLDAQKVQALQTCQRLRHFSRYFNFDLNNLNATQAQNVAKANKSSKKPSAEDDSKTNFFLLDNTSKMIENIPAAYKPIDAMDEEAAEFAQKSGTIEEIKVINQTELEIIQHFGIPSSFKLVETNASRSEELQRFEKKLKETIDLKTSLRADDYAEYMLEKGESQVDVDKFIKIMNKDGRQGQADVFFAELKDDPLAESSREPEISLKTFIPFFTPADLETVRQPSTIKLKERMKEREERVKRISGNENGFQTLNYEEAMYFSDSKYSKMINFYQQLEKILTIEWFITKLRFKHSEAIFIDQAIESGLPFWQETEHEQFLKQESKGEVVTPDDNEQTKLSQSFLYSSIISLKQKEYIASEIKTMASIVKNVIKMFKKTKPGQQEEYLQSYAEYRYMQVVGSCYKLIEQFQRNKNMRAASTLRKSLAEFTKTDHIRASLNRGNSLHVNSSFISAYNIQLNSSNLIHGFYDHDDSINFDRCVQAVVNEKACEPPQVTLFQALFQTDPIRKNSPNQFTGQFISDHSAIPFKSLDTALLELTKQEREYSESYITSLKYQADDYMETVCGESNLNLMQADDVYKFDQLEKAKKFISDFTVALLLKRALICWSENSLPAEDVERYQRFEQNYMDNYFWKCVEEKDQMKKMATSSSSAGVPSQDALQDVHERIIKLSEDQTLINETEEDKRKKLIALLKEEFDAMKKKVTHDNFFSVLAERRILGEEIEKEIIKASIRALDSETAALTRAFTLTVPKIQSLIHPFQQFAACQYDKVDPHSHLDIVQKCEPVQALLTKLRNRGTEVDTLTSGTGMVFTVKDLNECLNEFCRRIAKYSEQEMKSRCELWFSKENHYQQLLYVKDQEITVFKRRMETQNKNLDNLISARLFEKGNQLIYELDSSNRLISLYRRNLVLLEGKVREKVLEEQKNKFDRLHLFHSTAVSRFSEAKRDYTAETKKLFETEIQKNKEEMKKMKEKYTGADHVYEQKVWYPTNGQSIIRSESPLKGAKTGSQRKSQVSQVSGSNQQSAFLPADWKHYPFCTCYQPKANQPQILMEMAKLEIESEQQARQELAEAYEAMRKQRIFHATKEAIVRRKFQDEISKLKQQLSDNSYMWDKMGQQDCNEKVLKQELLYTQQSLSAAEKVIDKQKQEIEKVEAERQRLAKFKASKGDRLQELEDKIKNFEVYEQVDTDKLVNILVKNKNEMGELRSVAQNAENRINSVSKKASMEVKSLRQKFNFEKGKSVKCIEKMEQMKMELKMLESSDTAASVIWKKKCIELYEVCSQLKEENQQVRTLCNELISQGMQLTDAVNQYHDDNSVSSINQTGLHSFDEFQANRNAYSPQKHIKTLDDLSISSPNQSFVQPSTVNHQQFSLPKLASNTNNSFAGVNYDKLHNTSEKNRVNDLLNGGRRNILTAGQDNLAFESVSKSMFPSNQERGIMSANEPEAPNKQLFSSCKFGSGFDQAQQISRDQLAQEVKIKNQNAAHMTQYNARARNNNIQNLNTVTSIKRGPGLMNQTMAMGITRNVNPGVTMNSMNQSIFSQNSPFTQAAGSQRKSNQANDIASILNPKNRQSHRMSSNQNTCANTSQFSNSVEGHKARRIFAHAQNSSVGGKQRQQQVFQEALAMAQSSSKESKQTKQAQSINRPGIINSKVQIQSDSLYESSQQSLDGTNSVAYQVHLPNSVKKIKRVGNQAHQLRLNQHSEAGKPNMIGGGHIGEERNKGLERTTTLGQDTYDTFDQSAQPQASTIVSKQPFRTSTISSSAGQDASRVEQILSDSVELESMSKEGGTPPPENVSTREVDK